MDGKSQLHFLRRKRFVSQQLSFAAMLIQWLCRYALSSSMILSCLRKKYVYSSFIYIEKEQDAVSAVNA